MVRPAKMERDPYHDRVRLKTAIPRLMTRISWGILSSPQVTALSLRLPRTCHKIVWRASSSLADGRQSVKPVFAANFASKRLLATHFASVCDKRSTTLSRINLFNHMERHSLRRESGEDIP